MHTSLWCCCFYSTRFRFLHVNTDRGVIWTIYLQYKYTTPYRSLLLSVVILVSDASSFHNAVINTCRNSWGKYPKPELWNLGCTHLQSYWILSNHTPDELIDFQSNQQQQSSCSFTSLQNLQWLALESGLACLMVWGVAHATYLLICIFLITSKMNIFSILSAI